MAVLLPTDDRDRAIPGQPDQEPDQGDTLEGLEPGEVQENDDGTAVYYDPAADEPQHQGAFYENLAEVLDESELMTIADDLYEQIELDKKAREKRDKQYKDGIERAGLAGEGTGGAEFDGASKATHPALAKACVDFSAAVTREFLPPEGPAKPHVNGTYTEKKRQVAERQAKCLNWQLMTDVKEFVPEFEQLVTQIPAGGSQFLKFWGEPDKERWFVEFVPVDYVHIPYACSDVFQTHRLTHEQHITQQTFDSRVECGLYRDIEAKKTSLVPETSAAQKAAEKVEGVEPPMQNEDGLRIVYECRADYRISVDRMELRSYLITIDDDTRKVVSIYRNWDPDDEDCERLQWIVEFGFIPWRGAYKLGFYHLIGGMAIAATGALRALLDSAHINNAATAVMLKGKTAAGGQTVQPNIGQVSEITAPPGADDIRKVMMPMPFNPPSQVLYLLLGWVTDQMEGVVTTAEEKIADAGNNMPVGTALALIEQGQKVMSSIIGRLYRSMQNCFEIICRLNANGSLSTRRQLKKLGEVIATPKDFYLPMMAMPAADPRIFTEGQRFAQFQLATALLGNDPNANQYELKKWGLQTAKIPTEVIDKIWPKPATPTELNQAAENVSLLMGRPILAFPEQDHLAHIETLIRFMVDPMMGGAPWNMPKVYPMGLEHLIQHMGFYYAQVVHSLVSDAMEQSAGELLKQKGMSNDVDRLLAAASKLVHAGLQRQLGPLMPVLQRIYQVTQQLKPQMPMDPTQAAAMASLQETQRKASKDQADNQLEAERLRQQGADSQQQRQLEAQDQAARQALDQQELSDQREAQRQKGALAAAELELDRRSQQVESAYKQGQLTLQERDLQLRQIEDERRHQRETMKFALQLKEDQQPGNQVAGV